MQVKQVLTKVFRWLWRGAVVTLAFYGIYSWVWQAVRSYARSSNRTDADWTINSHLFPDGSMKAVITTFEGGHFLAPFCESGVSIISANSPDEIAKSADNQVFSGPCGGFQSSGSGQSPPEPRRINDKELSITFPLSFGAGQNRAEYILAEFDISKSVALSFAAHR